MIHSEDKEGIIIADKLTRVAVDRRIHVYALHHCWLPPPRYKSRFFHVQIEIHVIYAIFPPLYRSLLRCPVNGRMTRMTAINVSASISWFTAIDNIDMRAYTLSTHASLKRGSPSPARALRCLHWSPIPPPSLPIQFILTREFAHLFLPDLIDGRVPRWRDLRDHARRIDTPSKNGVWWIANKPTSLE